MKTSPELAFSSHSGISPRAAVMSILAFWLFYFVIITARALLMGFPDQVPMLFRRAGVTLFGIALTYGLYRIAQAVAPHGFRRTLVVLGVVIWPVAAAFGAANTYAFYVFRPPGWAEEWLENEVKNSGKSLEEMFMHGVVDGTFQWYFFFATWVALYMALCYAADGRAAERRAAAYRAQAQSAQLRALRYQINPHFLFNTLNSLSSLVMADRKGDAEAMIMHISTFFRGSLAMDPMVDVTLAEEIDLQKLYLAIEQVRFPDRLKVEIDIPAETRGVRLPGLLLQPIVENAIKYDVAHAKRRVTVTIRAWRDAQSLFVQIEDDGAGNTGTVEHGVGVGLRNVEERLEARFGASAQLDFGPREQGGFIVTLRLPVTSELAQQTNRLPA